VASVSRLITNLKALRLRHDITQEEFASISGFNYKYYQEIESGRKKQVLLETLDRLAEAYGIEPSELIKDAVPARTKLVKKPTPRFKKK
jgi:transcriptional regulator with XRE-family HTH domain